MTTQMESQSVSSNGLMDFFKNLIDIWGESMNKLKEQEDKFNGLEKSFNSMMTEIAQKWIGKRVTYISPVQFLRYQRDLKYQQKPCMLDISKTNATIKDMDMDDDDVTHLIIIIHTDDSNEDIRIHEENISPTGEIDYRFRLYTNSEPDNLATDINTLMKDIREIAGNFTTLAEQSIQRQEQFISQNKPPCLRDIPELDMSNVQIPEGFIENLYSGWRQYKGL